MKSLFSLALVLTQFLNVAYAQPRGQQYPQVDPLAAGYAFCNGLSFSSDKNQCMNIVNRAQYVDETGLQVCKGMSFTGDQLKCLNQVVDMVFDSTLSQFCSAHMSFSGDKLTCLGVIRGKFAKSPAALQVCAGITFTGDKLNCLRGVLVDRAPISVHPGLGCSRDQARALIDNTYTNLQRGRIGAALQDLSALANLVEYCFR